MQRLLHRHGLQGGLCEQAQGRAVRPAHAGHRQDTGILVQIQRILGDVELEPRLIQCARRQFTVERQTVNCRPQLRRALPCTVAKSAHAMLFEAISNVFRDRLGKVRIRCSSRFINACRAGIEPPPLAQRRDHSCRNLAVGRVKLNDGVGVQPVPLT